MKQIKKYLIFLVTPMVLLLMPGCEDFFQVETDDTLLENNHYKLPPEVYSTFIGVSAVFQEVADHTIILSELLSDLVKPTSNASQDYWDVYRFKASNGNPVAAPDLYYKVIINCNDFLRHVVQFNKDNPKTLEPKIYQGMISQVLGYRAWCYLTIGKLYGEAVYYDWALSDLTEISDDKLISFDDLLDNLLYSLDEGVDGQNGFGQLNWDDILKVGDVSWNQLRINPYALRGEIYMWKESYEMALKDFLVILNDNNEDELNKYKLSNRFEKSKWRSIFSSDITAVTAELLTIVPFDAVNNQKHQLQYVFSNITPNAYLLQPTDNIIELFNNQEGRTGNKGDRYRGSNRSFRTEAGMPVVYKYHIGKNSYESDANIPIYRAADIHLMAAEALNRLGLVKEAMSFLNHGLKPYWSGSYFNFPFSNPIYTNVLRENIGIRGRVDLKAYDLDELLPSGANDEDIMKLVDKLIADEVAMECAFEGKRWFALMRMANYWDDPEMLAEPISKKFGEEAATYKEILLKKDDWYISYDQLNNINSKTTTP